MRALVKFVDCNAGLSPLSKACRKDGILAVAAAMAIAGFDNAFADEGWAVDTTVEGTPIFPLTLLIFSKGIDGVTRLGKDLGTVVVICEGVCSGGGGVLIRGFSGGFNECWVLLALGFISRFGKTSNIIGKLPTELLIKGFVGNRTIVVEAESED